MRNLRPIHREIAKCFQIGIQDYWGVMIDVEHVNEYFRNCHRRFELLIDTTRRHSPVGSTILEVGAAYGHTLLALRQLGYQVLALDLPESVDVYGKALIDSNVAIIP